MADITGTSGNDTLIGTSGADNLFGLAGNDVLDGRGGADRMVGGTGDDIFYVDDGNDVVEESPGEGNDRINTSVSYALLENGSSSIEILSILDSSGTAAINLIGNSLGQIIVGNAGNNAIDGMGGADTMVGFGGNDIYYVDNTGDVVQEVAGDGNDRINTLVSYALLENGSSSIEILAAADASATSAINLIGNSLSQTIIGNAGNNAIDGMGGADTMVGFGGNDIYYVDNTGDVVQEVAGDGNDRINTLVSYALLENGSSSIEILAAADASATSAINLIGNSLGQTIIGNNGNNAIDGMGGADTMVGFGGNDTYYVDNTGDVVQEVAGDGNDRINTTVSYALPENGSSSIEVLSVVDQSGTAAINLIGNSLAQTIIGNAGNNAIDGMGGADTMVGLGGNDTYYVDNSADVVLETAGGGNDRINTTVSYALLENGSSSIEVLSVVDQSGTTAINLSGNSLAQTIIGNAGANILDGGGGNDVLVGLGGADSFAFTTALGAGNVDTILDFQPGTDKIQLGGNAGEPFAALASGALAAGSFVVGAAAAQADDYIVYNSATGALLYDADGNGAGAAVQFATLSTGLNLTTADFTVSGLVNHVPTVTSSANASVPENSPASTIVYQATGADADGDRITWTLGGTDAAYLTIDAVTGAVRLINPADFETKTSYAFTVTDSDSGSSSAPKAVTLNVTDVADSTTTPIIDETNAANDSTAAAQAIDRNNFNVSTNADLPDQTLPSATIHGSISTNNDIDYYAITLRAGEKIVLDVDHTTNSLDTFVRLYFPNGIEIVNNDDKISGDPGSNPPFDHNTDSYLTYRVVDAGTYYFSIESFGDLDHDGEDDGPTVGESNGNYSLNVSIAPPATAAQIMDEDIDALLSGATWNHTALSYGFPTDASQYPGSPKEVTPASDFSPFTAAQQGAAVQLLQLIANVSSLTFAPNSAAPGNADIRYAMSTEADVAYAYYPTNGGPSSVGGTAWFNSKDFNNPVLGNYAWMGILHETGHTLGLKHGHEAPAVSADHDSVEYTVMTYRSHPEAPLTGYTIEQWGYPQSLMMLDIAALQRMYGANFNTNSGNSVYGWNTTTGEMSINGVGQGAPGNGIGGSANRVFETIWDGGGNDTYDLSNYTTNVTVDLRPGEWSNFGTQLSFLGQDLGINYYARGNVANALLYQGNTASLIENAIGGSGFDTLIANQAANHLTGNGGSDTFTWMAASDGGTGALADTITDFTRGADKIDFTAMVHNSGAPLQFIGTAAFDHAAPELRYDVIGGNAHIFADVDGNGTADMEIVLDNVTVVAGSDFSGGVHSSGGASLPADLAGGPATDNAALSNAAVPATAPTGAGSHVVTGAVFGDFGGLADAQVPPAAMHDHASLAGMDFYF